MLNSGEWTLVLLLFAVHWGPLLLAMWLWPLKELTLSVKSAFAVLLSVASCIIVFICLFIFTDVKSGGNMTGAAAYLIYAVVSLGIVPVIVIAVHVLAGRFLGLLLRWRVARARMC